MDKLDKLFLLSSAEQMCPNDLLGKRDSDPVLHVKDGRVARLLVLLRQLHESAGGLGAFPKRDVSEIVSCAARLCGFTNMIEVRAVITTVLDALEMQDANQESP
jgi:hypothetical protein